MAAPFTINTTPKAYSKPYAILFKGRPDEPDSWKSIGVYSKEEREYFRSKGWLPDKEFMDRADRARRKDG